MNNTSNKPFVIGVAGRSGSGKTTLVRQIQSYFGPDHVSIHTMDNYYKERVDQHIDDAGYKNFDLPSSFYKEKFIADLNLLLSGSQIELEQYEYNQSITPKKIVIPSTDIIIVEGLFIYHYDDIRSKLDLKVMVDLNCDEAFSRRSKRDQTERNYSIEEITHRYFNHAEPAYLTFIHPHYDEMDLIVKNDTGLSEGSTKIIGIINEKLNPAFSFKKSN